MVQADFQRSATRRARSSGPAPSSLRIAPQPASVKCLRTGDWIAPPLDLIQINPFDPSPLAVSTRLSSRCRDHLPPPGTMRARTTPPAFTGSEKTRKGLDARVLERPGLARAQRGAGL